METLGMSVKSRKSQSRKSQRHPFSALLHLASRSAIFGYIKTFFAVIFLFEICVFAQVEPIYNGKPESFWLKEIETRGVANAAIRSNAAVVLATTGNPKILIPLVKNNFDPVVRKLTTDGLAFNANKDVTLALIDALGDKDSKVRAAAAAGLCLNAREQEPSAVPALIKHLEDSDPEVRCEAPTALSDYTNGVSAIIPALKEGSKAQKAMSENQQPRL